jgi:hypothetical protein
MTFGSVNYVAVLVAAIAAWLAGAAWYGAFGRTWMAAWGITPEMKQASMQQPGAYLPFIYAFAGEVIMAWTLAGVMIHATGSQGSVRAGLISGALCWLGFVMPVTLVNYSFARRSMRLVLIDCGHWLVVLLLMGAILGAMGVVRRQAASPVLEMESMRVLDRGAG